MKKLRSSFPVRTRRHYTTWDNTNLSKFTHCAKCTTLQCTNPSMLIETHLLYVCTHTVHTSYAKSLWNERGCRLHLPPIFYSHFKSFIFLDVLNITNLNTGLVGLGYNLISCQSLWSKLQVWIMSHCQWEKFLIFIQYFGKHGRPKQLLPLHNQIFSKSWMI